MKQKYSSELIDTVKKIAKFEKGAKVTGYTEYVRSAPRPNASQGEAMFAKAKAQAKAAGMKPNLPAEGPGFDDAQSRRQD